MPIFHNTKTHERFFFIHIPRTAGRFLTKNFWENGYGTEHYSTRNYTVEEVLAHHKSLNGFNVLHPIGWGSSEPRAARDTLLDYLWTPVDGVEFSHTHYSLYNKWKSIKDIPSIAIVRNPIDRFLSASGRMYNTSQSSLEDWTSFNSILHTYNKSIHNWWRPQHEFISPHTKIWKLENGFNKDFCKWINNILPINFSIKAQFHHNCNYDQPKFIKTKALTENIRKFYHQDFENFNY